MRNSEVDLPVLHHYARQMFLLAEEIFNSGFMVSDADHFGFMALCYGGKQLEHARSIGLLVDSYQYVDAAILSRVMLEGLVHLGWASLKADERGLRWRAYVLVSDWKLLQIKKEAGENTDLMVEKELKERLSQLGLPYLTKKARKGSSDAYADPYQNTWMVDAEGSKIELSEMIQEIGDTQLKMLYDSLSQYIHWTPRGVGELIRRDKGGVSFGDPPSNLAAMSCAVATQMLGHTLEIISSHFDLGMGEKVKKLFQESLEELG